MDVEFESQGTRLTGVVRRPAGDGPHPAVAFVDGSGPAERGDWDDEAEALAAAGFASLAWDKPGCGGSGGDWRDQSLHDRAAEALAAVACLAGQEGVDPRRIALLGGSQGGWVGPLAASLSPGTPVTHSAPHAAPGHPGSPEACAPPTAATQTPQPRIRDQRSKVAAVISLSGPGVSPYEQEAHRVEHMLREAGAGEDQVAEALAFFHHRAARLRRGDDLEEVLAEQLSHRDAPWYPVLGDDGVVEHLAFLGRIYDYDPAPVLARVTCPLLAIWGARDVYVPVAASAEAFAAALGRAGNGSFRLEVIPDADHGLRLPATGGAERGPRIPDLMDMVVTWLRRALPPGRG